MSHSSFLLLQSRQPKNMTAAGGGISKSILRKDRGKYKRDSEKGTRLFSGGRKTEKGDATLFQKRVASLRPLFRTQTGKGDHPLRSAKAWIHGEGGQCPGGRDPRSVAGPAIRAESADRC